MSLAIPQDTSAARGQATRSAVYGAPRHGVRGAAARRPGRGRHPEEGRQRGGRRDRRQRLPRAHGADGQRARRRPVRDRVGSEDEEARGAQRLGPRAARRSPPTSAARPKDGTIPLYSPYAWTCRAAPTAGSSCTSKYGKLPMAEVLAPAIRYAEEGFPLSPVIASDWERSLTRFKDKPGFARGVHARRPRAARGRAVQEPGAGEDAATARRGRAATPTTRAPIAEAHRARSRKAHGGFFSAEDFARHTSDVGRARLDRLPRLRRCGSCRRQARASPRSSS